MHFTVSDSPASLFKSNGTTNPANRTRFKNGSWVFESEIRVEPYPETRRISASDEAADFASNAAPARPSADSSVMNR